MEHHHLMLGKREVKKTFQLYHQSKSLSQREAFHGLHEEKSLKGSSFCLYLGPLRCIVIHGLIEKDTAREGTNERKQRPLLLRSLWRERGEKEEGALHLLSNVFLKQTV